MADCISQAAQAFLPQHIAGDPHNEEFVAAFAEHHFCGDASGGASQDGSKGNLRRHAPIAGAPAKSPWIKWHYAGLLTWDACRSFRQNRDCLVPEVGKPLPRSEACDAL